MVGLRIARPPTPADRHPCNTPRLWWLTPSEAHDYSFPVDLKRAENGSGSPRDELPTGLLVDKAGLRCEGCIHGHGRALRKRTFADDCPWHLDLGDALDAELGALCRCHGNFRLAGGSRPQAGSWPRGRPVSAVAAVVGIGIRTLIKLRMLATRVEHSCGVSRWIHRERLRGRAASWRQILSRASSSVRQRP